MILSYLRWLPAAFLLVAAISAPHANAADASKKELILAFNEAQRAYQSAIAEKDFSAAIEPAAEALELGKKLLPENDSRLGVLYYNHGLALYYGGAWGAAVEPLQTALEFYRQQYDADAPELYELNFMLGKAMQSDTENFTSGRPYLEDALKIAESHYGAEAIPTLEAKKELAFHIGRFDSRARARKLLAEVRETLEEGGRTETVLYSETLLLAANFISSAKKRLRYYETSLETIEGILPEGHNVLLTIHTHLLRLYEEKGERDKADRHALYLSHYQFGDSEREFEPVYRVAPEYPRAAWEIGQEGHVDITFGIDEHGRVVNPAVTDINITEGGEVGTRLAKNHTNAFRQAALDCIRKWRYIPAFENGQPRASSGHEVRLIFALKYE